MNHETDLIFTKKPTSVINCLVYFRTGVWKFWKPSLKSSICKIFLQEFYFLLNLNGIVMPPGWGIRAASRSSAELGFPKSQSNVCLYIGCTYNKYTQNYTLCIRQTECPGCTGLLQRWIAIFIPSTKASRTAQPASTASGWSIRGVCPLMLPCGKAFANLPPPCHSGSGRFLPAKNHRYLRDLQPAVNSSSME